MRRAWIFLFLLLAPAGGGSPESIDADLSWLRSESWEDGAAVVSVFRGRIKWYGEWRDAEVRHYVVREYMHAEDLVKMEPPGENAIPVLKANVLTSFVTGTYGYRQMFSMFLDRRTGRLAKAVGSSQEGCGASFQRWHGGKLTFDTYWAGEGAGSRPLAKPPAAFFHDELPVVAGMLRAQEIGILPSMVKSSVRDRSREAAEVTRDGGTVRVGERTYRYDAEGFLESWTVPGREELRRVVKKRLYYWQHNGKGDEKLLEAR